MSGALPAMPLGPAGTGGTPDDDATRAVIEKARRDLTAAARIITAASGAHPDSGVLRDLATAARYNLAAVISAGRHYAEARAAAEEKARALDRATLAAVLGEPLPPAAPEPEPPRRRTPRRRSRGKHAGAPRLWPAAVEDTPPALAPVAAFSACRDWLRHAAAAHTPAATATAAVLGTAGALVLAVPSGTVPPAAAAVPAARGHGPGARVAAAPSFPPLPLTWHARGKHHRPEPAVPPPVLSARSPEPSVSPRPSAPPPGQPGVSVSAPPVSVSVSVPLPAPACSAAGAVVRQARGLLTPPAVVLPGLPAPVLPGS